MGVVEIVLVVMIVIFISRRFRRQRRWEGPGFPREPYRTGMGRGGYAPDALPNPELQAHVESLESRIASLEERLDFTERLLQRRSEERE